MPNRHEHHRLPRSAFEPLRITAVLQSPAICDETLPIDAIIYFTAMRERYGEQVVTYSGGNHPNAVAGVQLPLARVEEEGPMWFYAASFAQWGSGMTEGQDHWNRRFDISTVDLVDWKGKKARVDLASGPYKSYHMPVYYRHALSVSWYVFGHRASIERLLAFTSNLGKKVSQGWGAVLRWEVERIAEDWSVRGAGGRLMRAVPSGNGAGILTGFRPSYWLPKNQAKCLMPDQAVTVNS